MDDADIAHAFAAIALAWRHDDPGIDDRVRRACRHARLRLGAVVTLMAATPALLAGGLVTSSLLTWCCGVGTFLAACYIGRDDPGLAC